MADLRCPNCSKEYVARVARVGFVEGLLGLFYVYPFKCQLWGCRASALQWGVRYLRMEEDRREYERLPTVFQWPSTLKILAATGWLATFL
jgi:hypothetical protein